MEGRLRPGVSRSPSVTNRIRGLAQNARRFFIVSTLSRSQRLALPLALFAALLLLVPAAFAAKGGGSTASSACSIAPGQVALDQVWTVSAWGLPSSVNLRITFPDGATSTGPITVASGGTYTTTGNSNMSQGWGFVTPEQKGTYTYQFVGRIRYPAGTFRQLYAACSVLVS
jgi:hypothetical protein